MVTDLHHVLDLPKDAPGPVRRLATHLGDIVRVATAAEAGTGWESALPCPRRPARRRCPGRVVVLMTGPGAPVQWRCSVCDDRGRISNWEESRFDLRVRRRELTVAEATSGLVITHEVAAALRDLQLLDAECERLVFGIRSARHDGADRAARADRAGSGVSDDGAVLAVTKTELEELLGFVAAEANHEPNRRRRQRLDAAYEALSDAAGGS